MIKIHDRTMLIQGLMMIFLATNITCPSRLEFQSSSGTSVPNEIVEDNGDEKQNEIEEDLNSIEQREKRMLRMKWKADIQSSETRPVPVPKNEPLDLKKSLIIMPGKSIDVDYFNGKLVRPLDLSMLTTYKEKECLVSIVLLFDGKRDASSCKEHAFFNLTKYMNYVTEDGKPKDQTLSFVMKNDFSREYYEYLRERIKKGKVESPRKFCQNNPDKNANSNPLCCIRMPWRDERIGILESSFGKTEVEAIDRAFYHKILNFYATNDVRYQYLTHISESVEFMTETLGPRGHCAKLYAVKKQLYTP